MLQRLTSKQKLQWSGALLIVVAYFALTLPAHAVTIAPARIELTGDPGQTITGTFVVFNEEQSERVFYTSAQNFEARGESGTPNFVDANSGLSTWVTVAPDITLAPLDKIEVPFSVTIPTDAEAGGHFAAVFLSTVPPDDGGQVAIGAKVGVLLLLRVAGEVPEEAGILEFGTKTGQLVFNSLPVDFTYRFSNSGGDRVNPRGTIAMRNAVWLKTEELNANPAEGNVLPGSVRRFDVSWGEGQRPAGFFGAVKYQWQNFAMGPYRVKLDVAYGVQGQASASTWVIVLPWQLMIVLAIVLAVLLPLILLVVRRYNQWIIRKAQQQLPQQPPQQQ